MASHVELSFEYMITVRENEEYPWSQSQGCCLKPFSPKLVTDSCINPPCLGSESYNVV